MQLALEWCNEYGWGTSHPWNEVHLVKCIFEWMQILTCVCFCTWVFLIGKIFHFPLYHYYYSPRNDKLNVHHDDNNNDEKNSYWNWRLCLVSFRHTNFPTWFAAFPFQLGNILSTITLIIYFNKTCAEFMNNFRHYIFYTHFTIFKFLVLVLANFRPLHLFSREEKETSLYFRF